MTDLTPENLFAAIRAFYAQAVPDPVIGHLFTDVAQLDLEAHLPTITAFWEGVLFGTGPYTGNPMAVHHALHAKHPLTPEHFNRWLTLWEDTLRSTHQGPKVEEAILRAKTIGAVMQVKIQG